MTQQTAFHARVPGRTIAATGLMLIGILFLGAGYFAGANLFFWAGLILVLSGIMVELVFGILTRRAGSSSARRGP